MRWAAPPAPEPKTNNMVVADQKGVMTNDNKPLKLVHRTLDVF